MGGKEAISSSCFGLRVEEEGGRYKHTYKATPGRYEKATGGVQERVGSLRKSRVLGEGRREWEQGLGV